MVPNFEQLVDFSMEINEAMSKTSSLNNDEIKIVFYCPHNALQKINEELYYKTEKDKNGEILEKDVSEIDIILNGIRFIYKEKEYVTD